MGRDRKHGKKKERKRKKKKKRKRKAALTRDGI
jgi:hypothetical protein